MTRVDIADYLGLSIETVSRMLTRLSAGGKVLREGDAPPHGGFRGYVADPDNHAWEIAWNPAWTIDDRGLVTFG
jgi:predicted lactoylglutathione lyase